MARYRDAQDWVGVCATADWSVDSVNDICRLVGYNGGGSLGAIEASAECGLLVHNDGTEHEVNSMRMEVG